ncbi:NACHT domain-containing protein [Moorena sp. SIO3B2]|uniref:NACHT domain-containing protein n=1 Tax=Moorena sp. SIO3B2 TaxID=2607827 RepID=UPI0013CBFC14|nr:NACHT domain-containing protein [Moorena sp. SIO3B2]NEP35609.1 NACHT domain-containing protein [Moorena sp. SIO3B2]
MSEPSSHDPNSQHSKSKPSVQQTNEASKNVGQQGGIGNGIFQFQWIGNTFNFFVGWVSSLTPHQKKRNRQALLTKVKNDWVKGVLEKSLYNQVLMELGLEERPDAITNPLSEILEIGDDSPQPFPEGTKVIDIFDQIGTGRTLLILGEPGSGKTTTLLELARDLIAHAEQDNDQLIPVVFNLSSWANKRQTITDWLVEELATKYYVNKKIGQALVTQQQLLPLLDGLDEVKAEYRNDCIVALNKFHQKYGAELVVCSRIKDYKALPNRLNFQKAVYIRLLILDQVCHYLNRVGDDLTGLRTLIEEDIVLQQLAQSPLMLNMMTLAYQGVAVEDLPRTDVIKERRKQLFYAYIEKMFKRRKTNQKYEDAQVKHWLIWLAQRMVQESQTIFLIERMQPSWLTSNAKRLLYTLIVRLFIGIIVTLVLGIIAVYSGQGLEFALVYSPLGGLIFALVWESTKRISFKRVGGLTLGIPEGLIFALLFALARYRGVGLEYGIPEVLKRLAARTAPFILTSAPLAAVSTGFVQTSKIEPVEILTWSWRRTLRRGLPISLGIGLFSGFIGLGSPIAGLFISLFGSFLLGLVPRSNIESNVRPNQGIQQSLYNALRQGISLGLAFGVAIGVPTGLERGLSYGLIAVLILGIVFGGLACIQHLILRSILSWSGQVPWNYADFLDYAADRIFLVKVGGGYIFIHRLLQEHFAAMANDLQTTGLSPSTQRRKCFSIFALIALCLLSIPFIPFRVTKVLDQQTTQAILPIVKSLEKKACLIVEIAQGQLDHKDHDKITLDSSGNSIPLIVKSLEKKARLIVEIAEGQLDHKNNEKITRYLPGNSIPLQNFIAQVRFFNPYDHCWKGRWDYGFLFRNGKNAEYRLLIRANSTWELKLVDNNPNVPSLASGKINNLDVSANGSNTMRLIVENQTAYFFVNGEYIATLDLSEHQSPRLLYIGTGFYKGSEINGKTTKFTDFSVWSLDPLE